MWRVKTVLAWLFGVFAFAAFVAVGSVRLVAALTLLVAGPALLIRYVKPLAVWANTEYAETLKAVLATLGVGVVLFWLLQGLLAPRLELVVNAVGHQAGTEKTLIIVSVDIENTGTSNAGVVNAGTTVTAACGATARYATDLGMQEMRMTPGHKDGILKSFQLVADEYTIVWGTHERRQIAVVADKAECYDITVTLETRHPLIRESRSTWRTTTILPMTAQVASSPSTDTAAKARTPSVLAAFFKMLGFE